MDGDKALHVIVFDEFDAIAVARMDHGRESGGGEGSRAANSVVNQLLAKIDGVDQVDTSGPPVLIIALTNRRDLIDAALLRPGRLEVQIEITPPNAQGRYQILSLLCGQMYDSRRVMRSDLSRADFDAFLRGLAAETHGFTGADLAGMVRAATARALARAHAAVERGVDWDLVECLVTIRDQA